MFDSELPLRKFHIMSDSLANKPSCDSKSQFHAFLEMDVWLLPTFANMMQGTNEVLDLYEEQEHPDLVTALFARYTCITRALRSQDKPRSSTLDTMFIEFYKDKPVLSLFSPVHAPLAKFAVGVEFEVLGSDDGHLGTLYANSLFAHSTLVVGDDDDPGALICNRSIVNGTEWFVCNAYANQGKGAGRVRLLSHGSVVRPLDKKIINQVLDLLRSSKFKVVDDGDWKVSCLGVILTTTMMYVRLLVTSWALTSKSGGLTIHMDEELKMLVICCEPGVVMRPLVVPDGVRSSDLHGPYVDSFSILTQSANLSGSMTSSLACTMPLFRFIQGSRPIIAMSLFKQAIQFPSMFELGSLRPSGPRFCPVLSSLSSQVLGLGSRDVAVALPLSCALVAFIAHPANYEDGIVISKSFSECKRNWVDCTYHHLHYGDISGVEMIDKAAIEDAPKIPHPYASYGPGLFGKKPLGISRDYEYKFRSLVKGDKLATLGGLKGVVCEILDDDEMPRVKCPATGKLVIPDMLWTPKNSSRGLACDAMMSKNLEHVFGRCDVPQEVKDIHDMQTWFNACDAFPHVVQREDLGNDLNSGHVYNSVKQSQSSGGDRKLCSKSLKPIMCSFGMLAYTRQRQLAYLSQHFPDRFFKGVSVGKSLRKGGTPSLGESEISVLRARSLPRTLTTSAMSDDACVVDVCNSCDGIVGMFCTCLPENNPGHRRVMVRSSLIKFATILTCFSAREKSSEGNESAIVMRIKQ